MIIDYNTSGSSILPNGDSYELPPGTGQFRVASLLGLLTAAAFIAGIGKCLEFDIVVVALLEIYAVYVWWQYAQLRVSCESADQVDQSALRDEVREWLYEREQSSTG